MGNIRNLFSSFRVKVTLALIFSMFFVGALNNFLIYRYTLDSQFSTLRNRLMLLARTAVLMIDPGVLMEVPLDRDGVNSSQFKSIVGILKKIKEANPPIDSIYTLTRTGKKGIWQFIVDDEPADEEDEILGTTAYPGDEYDASRFPEMMKAFDGPSADTEFEVDEWGATLSGYAPIRDKKGNAVAVLGVDIKADEVYGVQGAVRRRALSVLVLGIILSIFLGIFLAKRITNPIKKLVDGTNHIADGDLKYQVEIPDHDEISELARSFNKMGASLYESRRKLHDYFYRVMQSLVRILEAKDGYTEGHSERVAEYSERIALKLGFSQGRAELIKRTAQLHDIGKLAIQQSILNKEGRLTEGEWRLIREHPIVGEDILKPVVFDKEMLAMVRSHHERYDGVGYPDKINGKNINIFAQIISVADSYDAMTSARAYRPALSKEEAIEELKKNSGTQFNPRVVEAFLEVLEEEDTCEVRR